MNGKPRWLEKVFAHLPPIVCELYLEKKTPCTQISVKDEQMSEIVFKTTISLEEKYLDKICFEAGISGHLVGVYHTATIFPN